MTDPIETHFSTETDKGARLDKWLAGHSELSRSRIRALIEEGAVTAGGEINQNPSSKVVADTVYEIIVPPPVSALPEPENIPLDIVFEDEHLIVINKPAGMTVHPAPGSPSGTLVNALLHHAKDSLSGIGGVLRP
ncbi:MAG: RluA family pseudouridine synthase, partial [Hellea sp.]|nr:RluA family pseudouridine synthase [Hellea sp.]